MLGVFLLTWTVNGLLLGAVAGFLEGGIPLKRILPGAFLGALGTALSLVSQTSFLGSWMGRAVVLLVMSLWTFGLKKQTLFEGGLFVLLHLSVGGLTVQTEGWTRMLPAAVGIYLACRLAPLKRRFVPVELSYGQTRLVLTALYDTGNGLSDPVTGQSVLIVDAPTAFQLTGLTQQQLNCPVESLKLLPGLRLIPYHTVGNSGFLLALRLQDVKLGHGRKSCLVAFSPQTFGKDYQALTGGTI